MTDNVLFTPGTGGTLATDEVGGVHYIRQKISVGPDGSATDMTAAAGPVAAGTPRVTLASDDPAAAVLGLAADAASATTTIKAALRGIATALGITALDLGSGTGGSRTLRWFQDTAQWIGGAGAVTAAVQRTTLASDDPAVATLGAIAGAAVITDANGSIQQYLRGLVKLCITAGGVLARVDGQVAHDAAVSGNPVRTGARARSSNVTAVSSDDQIDAIATLVGARIQKPYSIPEADWSYAAATSGIVNTTTAVTVAAAAGSGLRNYVTWLDLMSEALGTATEVAIRDGAGGTVLWRTKIATAGLLGGRYIKFPNPLKSTANTLLEVVTLTASGSGAVYANLGGYTAP